MEDQINFTGSWTLLVVECINYDENSRSGGVAAVDNGSGLVCKPYTNYRTFVCTTELKRRAANYSETAVGDLKWGFWVWDRGIFKSHSRSQHSLLLFLSFLVLTLLGVFDGVVSHDINASRYGSVEIVSVQPTPQHHSEELAGSVTVRLRCRAV